MSDPELAPRPAPDRAVGGLVGREGELALLNRAVRSCVDGVRLVVVSGPSGIGKSALAAAAVAAATDGSIGGAGHLSGRGKFDQYLAGISFEAPLQALTQLCTEASTQPPELLARLRRGLITAGGSGLSLLIGLVPMLGALLGLPDGSADATVVGTQQADRLELALAGMVKAFTLPGRPLVLLFDDVQWADAATLSLLSALLLDDSIRGLCIVVTYRTPPSDRDHRFAEWLVTTDPDGFRGERLELAPLNADGVGALVARMMDGAAAEVADALELVRHAAAGNPLYVIEAVRGLLALHRGPVGPARDAALEQVGPPGAAHPDIGSLLHERMKGLQAPEMAMMTIAACAGRSVDLTLLADVSRYRASTVVDVVERLVDGRLLELSSLGRLRGLDAATMKVHIAHDQIQGAVRAAVGDRAWKSTHLRLSEVLAASPLNDLQSGMHLASAVELLVDAPRRLEGLGRLVLAAEQARRSAAFDLELQLLAVARSLRADDAWERSFDATYALEASWHRALSTLGRHDECLAAWEALRIHARTAIDLIEPTVVEMVNLQGRSSPREAVALGLALLRRVAPELRFDALGTDLSSDWKRFRTELDEWPLESLADAPPADALTAAVAGLLVRTADAGYGDPSHVTAWCGLSLFSIWRHRGFHESMVTAALYLDAHAAAIGERDIGFRLVTFGMTIARRHANLDLRATMELGYSMSVAPWHRPLEESVDITASAFERLQRSGNIELASYAAVSEGCTGIEIAPTLLQVEQSVTAGLQFAQRLNLAPAVACLTAMLAFTGGLRRRSVANVGNPTGYPWVDFYLMVYPALGAVIMRDEVELARHVATLRPLLPHLEVFYPGALGTFASCWLDIDRIATGESTEVVRLDAGMAFLQDAAERSPANFAVLDRLLRARRAAAEDRPLEALAMFDAAMQAAALVSRPWHHALAVEHAGRFCMAQRWRDSAERLLREAHRLYMLWGATRKAYALLREFRFLADEDIAGDPRGESSPPPREVDRAALFHASQALSSETDMARLVERMLAIVMQLTAATSAVLLRRTHADDWEVIGRTAAGERVPDTLVAHASRIRQSEAVRDLATDPRFADDPAIGGGPRSVLITPIADTGPVHSILLLENSHVAGFFTSTHVDTVELVAGQLSISLRNAELYQTLETRVAGRTAELQHATTALALRDKALESSANGVHISELTPAGNLIVYVNPMLATISGFSAAELTGSSIWSLFGAEQDQPGARRLREAVDGREAAGATVRCHRRDGSAFWNEMSISPVQSAHDGRIYFVGVHVDVSERMQAAEEDKRRTDRLRAVFELSPDGFVVLDSTARVSIVNPAFSQMTGLDPQQLLGRERHEFERALEQVSHVSGELIDPDAFARVLAREPDKGTASSEPDRLLTLARPRPRTLVRRMRRAETGPETVLYFRDVTRELEIDHTRSEFLSIAAHELRTPMTSIHGFGELLVSGRIPPDQQAQVHAVIHRRSSTLVSLVSQLLDLTRLDPTHGAALELRPAAIQPVVRKAITALRSAEVPDRVVDAMPADDAIAALDGEQFQLAVTSTLRNALAFSSAPVEVDLVTRGAAGHRLQVGVRIRDRGIGMSPPQLERLFERFYRADPLSQASGSGLGTNIVRDIMSAHDGQVEVTSDLGVGTVVTLWLYGVAAQ